MTKTDTGPTFLVLDDDALLRLTAKNILRHYTQSPVLEAGDGTQALEILRGNTAPSVDVVLCDLNMPGMDGMEFLRHLAEMSSKIAVVIVTAHDDSLMAAVKRMAEAYGVTLLGSVQKPLSRGHVEQLLQQYQALRSQTPKALSGGQRFTLKEILQGLQDRQFEPFFQPKVNFQTGAVTGAEALARWLHPDYGIVSPFAFIDLLETSGDIDKLTFSILEKAVAACRVLHGKGRRISISVNLSLNTLGDPQLADRILQVVRQAGVDPQYIVLEVTESAAMKDIAHSLENLARLRMHGFSLSIDDYGTGFSNIQQITRVPFQELKIDQSFVKGCNGNNDLGIIVRSSIQMAHQLKMQCTAEGVETREDWDMLKSMSCDTAQGYFIAKPMPLAALCDFMAA